MGQYYLVVNIDKREFLEPNRMGDGLKLAEFGTSGDGTMAGLALLLADGNGRGSGDIDPPGGEPDAEVSGRWAGDRIVIAGDYADAGKWKVEGACPGGERCATSDHRRYCVRQSRGQRTLYAACRDDASGWRDLSAEVRKALEATGVIETRDSWNTDDTTGKPEFQGTARGDGLVPKMRPDVVIYSLDVADEVMDGGPGTDDEPAA